MKTGIVILAFCCAALVASCSTTRSLSEGEYLLRKNTVVADDPAFNVSSLSSYISQKPNSSLAGFNPLLYVYNWGGDGKTGIQRFFRTIGAKPVVYEEEKMQQSLTNIGNHLTYMGYYGSKVSSSVEKKGKKAYVTYDVVLGNRYKISDIEYEVPEYGTFAKEFADDIPNSTVAAGQYLSEYALEKESERSAAYFREQGYYGFSKSYYAFEADTSMHDGTAHLKMSIRDYALGDSPSSAQEHRKFTIGNVTVSHPENLKIRPSVITGRNIMRPGQLYSESLVNTNYSRFSSIGVLTGVNVDLEPVGDDKVDCNISLRSSGIQGFKTNLEGSFNSTGLFGISPQLNYYHRNIFHGGEQLSFGVKGNFQFQPNTSAYSTDVSVTSSLRFPNFIGIPTRVFTGPNIPSTEVSAAFSYQDRPEFRRTVISSAYTYSGRFGQNLFYQLTPLRANISHLYDIDEEFLIKVFNANPILFMAYLDRFDIGVGGTLYYTTNSSAVPMTPYHYARLSVDASGNVISLFNNLLPVDEEGQHTIWDTPYAQYVRAELNLGKVFRFGREEKHALALHFGGGIVYAYGNSGTAPVDKFFYVGGANSMRGWQARVLGPGNTEYIEYFAIPSQLADMKLEVNAEYRFPIVSKLEGALFLDCGNIWEINDEYDPEANFSFKNLPVSLGIDWGFGLRLNVNFLILRLDTGIRLRDPQRPKGNRWVPTNEWFNGNTAIHFGVGYPF